MTTNYESAKQHDRGYPTPLEGQQAQSSLTEMLILPNGVLVMGPIGVRKWPPRRFTIMPNRLVLMIAGGQVAGILTPGDHYTVLLPIVDSVYFYVLSAEQMSLLVETRGECKLLYHPVETAPYVEFGVDVTVSVTYQVADPERVALVINDPLSRLHALVVQAMRPVISRLSLDEFVTGQWAEQILEGLRRLSELTETGMRVIHVELIERLLPADLEAQRRGAAVRAAEQQAAIQRGLAASEQGIPAIIEQYPELFRQQLEHEQRTREAVIEALTKMMQVGMRHPALEKTLEQVDDNIGMLTRRLAGPSTMLLELPDRERAGNRLGPGTLFSRGGDGVEAEIQSLQRRGLTVEVQDALGEQMVHITTPTRGMGVLAMSLAVGPDYPTARPQMWVFLDGAPQRFEPRVWQMWSAEKRLLDLVEAALEAFA